MLVKKWTSKKLGYQRLSLFDNSESPPRTPKKRPKILIELQAELVLPLVDILNQSPQDGRLPLVWKQANVYSIFNKSDRADPANHRPVSPTSCICKILQSICYAIYNHLYVNNILCNEQFGSRSGRSCN